VAKYVLSSFTLQIYKVCNLGTVPSYENNYLRLEAGVGPTEVLSPEHNAGLELVVLRQDGPLAWRYRPRVTDIDRPDN
jgi:hypothetical protein